jgi:hypothetical protein
VTCSTHLQHVPEAGIAAGSGGLCDLRLEIGWLLCSQVQSNGRQRTLVVPQHDAGLQSNATHRMLLKSSAGRLLLRG